MVGHCNDIKFICKVISDGPHFRYLKGRLYTLPTKNKTKSLIFTTNLIEMGAVVVVMAWLLDLQLPM